jgi:hypothetical protein
MNESIAHDFGVVDDKGDIYEFHLESDLGGQCRLEAIVQTERGPRRNELASMFVSLWNDVSNRVIHELVEGMGENERLKKTPNLKNGINRLSPLIGRELAVLLWALMEMQESGSIEAILHGWRELAREERWWLYAKAAAPGQRAGAGWRRALFHALSETPESRVTDPMPVKKKSPGSASRSVRRAATKKMPEENQERENQQVPTPSIPPTTARRRRQPTNPPKAGLNQSMVKKPAVKKVAPEVSYN